MLKQIKTIAAAITVLILITPSALARPGDGKPLDAVNPAYTIEQARPDNFKPQVGALAFLPNGKLAVTSFVPANNGKFRDEYNGTLYIIDNPTEKDPSKITFKAVNKELHDPLGANVVDGVLYTCDRNEISKWTDTDNDGYPDKKETFASGWVSDNYHHFTFGLPYDGENFYVALSTNVTFKQMIKAENMKGMDVKHNGPNPKYRGSLLKINGKTGEFSEVVGGLRTPNGVALGPDGVILCPDNQGVWKPASGIYAAEQGAFYGYYNNTKATSDFYPDGGVPAAFSDQPITPPAIWVPQNECANSPGEMIKIPEGHAHAGQYLMAEINMGGLRRAFFEKVDGTWQGAIFRHSQGFEVGTNRLEWGPDGCLYVGGTGAGTAGTWGWNRTKFGLQRMRPTGKTAFEFDKIEATKDGFRLSYTKPVDKAVLENPASYAVHAWTYKHTAEYGGPKIPKDKKQQAVAVKKAVASAAGLSVELILDQDRKPSHLYHFRSDIASKSGEQMWSPEGWFTFHKAPK